MLRREKFYWPRVMFGLHLTSNIGLKRFKILGLQNLSAVKSSLLLPALLLSLFVIACSKSPSDEKATQAKESALNASTSLGLSGYWSGEWALLKEFRAGIIPSGQMRGSVAQSEEDISGQVQLTGALGCFQNDGGRTIMDVKAIRKNQTITGAVIGATNPLDKIDFTITVVDSSRMVGEFFIHSNSKKDAIDCSGSEGKLELLRN
jgi:hypothetical protein